MSLAGLHSANVRLYLTYTHVHSPILSTSGSGNDCWSCSLIYDWMHVNYSALPPSLLLSISRTLWQRLSVAPRSQSDVILSRNPSSGKPAHLVKLNWLRARNILSGCYRMVVGCTWTKSGKINASRGETSGNDGSPHRFPGKYVRNVGACVTAREITRRKIKSPTLLQLASPAKHCQLVRLRIWSLLPCTGSHDG